MTDRELDALVAQHVFGKVPGVDWWDAQPHDWKDIEIEERLCEFPIDYGYGEHGMCCCDLMSECKRCDDVRCESSGIHDEQFSPSCERRHPVGYSTRVVDGWRVVVKMRSMGWAVAIDCEETGFIVHMIHDGQEDESGATFADTIARATCLAALKALGVTADPPPPDDDTRERLRREIC